MYYILYTTYYIVYTIYYMKDTNSKLNKFSSKVRPWRVENRPTINSRWLSWALLDLSWGYLGAILGISWAQDNPKTAPREPQMPLLCYLRAILGSQDGSLGLSWGYLTFKIHLEMAQKVWVFSSETNLGRNIAPSSFRSRKPIVFEPSQIIFRAQ